MDAVITLGVLAIAVVGLATNRLSPPSAILGATATIFVLGILEPAEAFGGFANPAPLTVAALYIVAGAIGRTGALQPLLDIAFDDNAGPRRMLSRLLLPAAAGSAFLANTPIVAMLVSPVASWAENRGRAPSKILIPLSYATILGGAVTAIGTSTNLVASGLLEAEGEEPLAMFELAKLGLPVAVVGLVLIIGLAPKLLPDRSSASEEVGRSYVVSMIVEPGGPLDGLSVEAAGLRHLQGVFLAEVDRDSTIHAPVAPSFVLRGADRLTFVGRVDLVLDLQAMRGLESSEIAHLEAVDHGNNTFFEAVVGASSPLAGRTLKDADFRARYSAAVVAIHRSGQQLEGKLGQIRIRPGDTLLVLASREFRVQWRHKGDFLLISRLGGAPPSATRKAPITLALLVLLVALPLLGVTDVFRSALIAAGATVLLGVQSPREARDAIDLSVVVTIGAAFGLGAALEEVGIAESVADGLIGALDGFGSVGLILGLLVATVALTELVTNAAAVVLVFPIASRVAVETGLDGRLLIMAVAVAASASFLTPIGYQTNTMVYGPGGYRFTDYLRLGIPLSLATLALLTTLVTNLS
jgi:di/tricarboxylate transporter